MSRTGCALAMLAVATTLTITPVSAEDETPGAVLKSISPKELQAPTVAVTLNKLREVGNNIRLLRTATEALYTEALQTGSKDGIDKSMAAMRPMIATMKANSDHFTSGKQGFECTNEVRVAIQPDLEEWRDSVNNLAEQFESLERLTQSASYDGKAIANNALQLKGSVKTINAARRRIYKAVRYARRDYY